MRYVRVPLVDKSQSQSISTARGGVCRMGRLKRLTLKDSSALHDTFQSHRCWVNETVQSMDCVATRSDVFVEDEIHKVKCTVERTPLKEKATAPILQTTNLRRTLCSKCDEFHGMKIAKKDGSIHDLHLTSPGSRQQLSVGHFTKLSTERMVAHALHKEFCGNYQSVSDCKRFQENVDLGLWESGRFLS